MITEHWLLMGLTAALLSLSLIFSSTVYASSDTADQAAQAPDPNRTLWDKNISPTMLQVPGDIFADGETSIAALSTDGTKVLLERVNQMPCLADVESGEITWKETYQVDMAFAPTVDFGF